MGINIDHIKGEQVNVGEFVHAVQNINQLINDEKPIKLIHIIGEEKFGKADAEALKQRNIKLITIHADTIIPVKLELERMREDNEFPKYIHISAHGSHKDGILLNNKWYLQEWFDIFSELDNIEIMFFAACESVDVADLMSPLSKYVVATAINIPDIDAIKATKIFWRYISAHESIEVAYNAMQRNIPNFYDNMRIRGLLEQT